MTVPTAQTTPTMRRVLRRQPREGAVLVQSPEDYEQNEQENLGSLMKKPFRCLVGGGREFEHMDHVMSPEEQYVPPGGDIDYGFEAIVQEGKKKKNKNRSFRKKEKSMKEMPPPQEKSMEEMPPPPGVEQAVSLHKRNRSLEEPPRYSDLAPYALPRNRSFEDGADVDSLVSKSRSFADAIPGGKKNDPLDEESIRDVSKALREMERKLAAAGTDGKKVSRTKVMKALLTVVDQLDDEPDFSTTGIGTPPSNNTSTVSSSSNTLTELYRTWTGDGADEVALDRQRRNLEQMRELTITPQKDFNSRLVESSPAWKGDKPSFSKVTADLKATATASTEAEPDYISSSSDDEEEETMFSQETEESRGKKKKKKKQGKQKGSFAHAVYDEEKSFFSDETPSFRDFKKTETKRGKSEKGSFAHAVSPSAANPSTSFDLFSLDMKDPAVQDALSDLLWIPNPNTSFGSSQAPVVTPEKRSMPTTTSSDKQGDELENLRKESQSMLSYHSEQEYYDKPDVGEETTTATTQSSSMGTSFSQQPKSGRESSWWRRNKRTALKPPSKDTPNVVDQQSRQVETKVTVTQYDYDETWRNNQRWEEY